MQARYMAWQNRNPRPTWSLPLNKASQSFSVSFLFFGVASFPTVGFGGWLRNASGFCVFKCVRGFAASVGGKLPPMFGTLPLCVISFSHDGRAYIHTQKYPLSRKQALQKRSKLGAVAKREKKCLRSNWLTYGSLTGLTLTDTSTQWQG